MVAARMRFSVRDVLLVSYYRLCTVTEESML